MHMTIQAFLSGFEGYAQVIAKRPDGSNINYPGVLVRITDMRNSLGVDTDTLTYAPTTLDVDQNALQALGGLRNPKKKQKTEAANREIGRSTWVWPDGELCMEFGSHKDLASEHFGKIKGSVDFALSKGSIRLNVVYEHELMVEWDHPSSEALRELAGLIASGGYESVTFAVPDGSKRLSSEEAIEFIYKKMNESLHESRWLLPISWHDNEITVAVHGKRYTYRLRAGSIEEFLRIAKFNSGRALAYLKKAGELVEATHSATFLKRNLSIDAAGELDPYQYDWMIGNWNEELKDEQFDDLTPEQQKEFTEWLTTGEGSIKVDRYKEDNPVEAPPSDSMRFIRYIKPNDWLVHFSNDAYAIAIDGFAYGSDYEGLHLTTWKGEKARKDPYGEYAFAYEVYSRTTEYNARKGSYGKYAVIFQSSDAVLVDHYGDEEQQVIFRKDSAKNRIYLGKDDGGLWCITDTRSGREIVHAEKIGDLAAWADQNLAQYRRRIAHESLEEGSCWNLWPTKRSFGQSARRYKQGKKKKLNAETVAEPASESVYQGEVELMAHDQLDERGITSPRAIRAYRKFLRKHKRGDMPATRRDFKARVKSGRYPIESVRAAVDELLGEAEGPQDTPVRNAPVQKKGQYQIPKMATTGRTARRSNVRRDVQEELQKALEAAKKEYRQWWVTDHHSAMEVANEILGGNGIEKVEGDSRMLYYVDMGDMSDETVCFDNEETPEFFIGVPNEWEEEHKAPSEDPDNDNDDDDDQDNPEETDPSDVTDGDVGWLSPEGKIFIGHGEHWKQALKLVSMGEVDEDEFNNADTTSGRREKRGNVSVNGGVFSPVTAMCKLGWSRIFGGRANRNVGSSGRGLMNVQVGNGAKETVLNFLNSIKDNFSKAHLENTEEGWEEEGTIQDVAGKAVARRKIGSPVLEPGGHEEADDPYDDMRRNLAIGVPRAKFYDPEEMEFVKQQQARRGKKTTRQQPKGNWSQELKKMRAQWGEREDPSSREVRYGSPRPWYTPTPAREPSGMRAESSSLRRVINSCIGEMTGTSACAHAERPIKRIRPALSRTGVFTHGTRSKLHRKPPR